MTNKEMEGIVFPNDIKTKEELENLMFMREKTIEECVEEIENKIDIEHKESGFKNIDSLSKAMCEMHDSTKREAIYYLKNLLT